MGSGLSVNTPQSKSTLKYKKGNNSWTQLSRWEGTGKEQGWSSQHDKQSLHGKEEKCFTRMPSQYHLPLLSCPTQNWMITVILVRFSMLAQSQFQEVPEYPESDSRQ